MCVYTYASSDDIWWKGIESKLSRFDKLQVWRLPTDATRDLAGMAERSMQLQATVLDGTLTLSSDKGSVSLEPVRWK